MAFSTRKLFLSFLIGVLFTFGATNSFAQSNALHFDGINDRMIVGSDTALNLNTQITIESWIKPSANGGDIQTVLSKSSYTENTGYIFPRTNDNWNNIIFYLNFNGIGWEGLEVPYTGAIGSWTHVAATYNGGFMRIYINGILAGEKEVIGTITVNTNPLTVGYHNGFEGIESEYYKGSIDEIRIWRRALTQCEIANNRTCELPASGQSGLVSYFKLNQGVAGLVNNLLTGVTNSVAGGANATLSNFGLFGTVSNWVDGIASGTCAEFAPPVVSVTSTQTSYLEGSTIQLNATGGVSYSWTGPGNFSSNAASPSLTATSARAGVYTAIVTTASGCAVRGSVSVQVAGSAGRGLNFDGVNDRITIPNSPSFNTGTGLTIEAWIYPTDNETPFQSVINKSTFATQGYVFPRTDDAWRSISFYVHLEGQGWKIARAPYPMVNGIPEINKWHHVAATYDGFKLRIYIDGVLSATEEFQGTISRNTNPVTIGNQPGYPEYFRGTLDEVRIWDRALDLCEITNNMNCQLALPATGLAAYYQFNQGLQNVNNINEKTLIDASGNNNIGTLNDFSLQNNFSNWTNGKVNNVSCAPFTPPSISASVNGPVLEVGNTLLLTASAPGATSYSWTGPNNFTSNQQNPTINSAQIINSGTYVVTANVEGCSPLASVNITVANKAGTIHLDGVDDVLSRPTNSSLDIRNEITLESWIYPTSNSPSVQSVMGKSSRAENNSYIFPRTDDGWNSLNFYLHLDGQWRVLTVTEFNGLNKWHHVAATYDGFFMRIYVDGVLRASQEATGKITQNINAFTIGNQPGFTEFYRGKLEEARVWSRALNQCEIINNMNCELLPQQNNLVAYYKFNQGWANSPNTETSVIDASTNGNNLTLSGIAQSGNISNWAEFKVNGTCTTYAEPPVSAQANGSIFGVGSTIRLFANGGSDYRWAGPDNFTSSSPGPIIYNAQLSKTGTYTVAIPFVNCEVYRSVRLTVTNLPAIQASGNTTICPSSTVQLSIASAGTAYQWYRNDEAIEGANSATYAAGISGNYSVGVTIEGNVQISAPISVTVVDNVPPSPNVATLPTLNVSAPVTITNYPTASDNCRGTITATTNSPLTFTQGGTFTIIWNYNDGNGNTTSQSQQVVVTRNDNTPPVLNNVPNNITVSCASIPSAASVTAIDDLDGSVPVTLTETTTRNADINTTAHYNYIITRTWSASDASGNTTTVSRTITVVDNQAPAFGVINNINVPAAMNTNGANVNYNVVAVDACGSPIAYSYTILSGSFFAIGTTTVQVTATDVSGNSASASFTVRVSDTQAPIITAPAGITVNTNPGSAFATGINLGQPSVSDNSGSGVVITNNAPSQFPIGNTTVTWTATDAAGNSATATQVVRVNDIEFPVLTAPATVTVGTNNSQAFATNVSLGTPTATDNSGSVNISNNAPNQFPIGSTTITWTATDASGNQVTATQIIIVVDNEVPVLVAPSNKTVSTNAGVNFATGVSLGTASGYDNSGLAVDITNNAPAVYNLGTNPVTWTIKDAFGNTATAIQIITVVDTESPVISNLSNIIVDAPSGSNTAIVASLGTPTATDNVQLLSLTNNASGNVYPIGTTSIEWTAIDAAGNKTTAIQLVIVRDKTAPILNGVPSNVNVSCGSIPAVATVTASDNFDPNVTVNFTESSTRGSNPTQASFYNYVITRSWTAADVAGNQVSASQLITVSDNQAPVMAQPVNIATNSALGTCGAIVNYTVNATDNCGSPISYTFSQASGTVFQVGITTVTVTARDASGNSVTRSFTVTVTDNQAPVITAPANINVTLGTTVNLGTATASDNCGVPVITNNAPATFPLGVTLVTWTATDAAGNRATATQTVTVVALTNCSSSITVVPENNTYTGGVPTNIYLGYGPQRVTLRTTATGGTSYTYSWTVVSGNATLSSTTSSQPIFAPTQAGSYTFEVRVRTQAGCVSTSRVTICVKDIRVKDSDDDDDDDCDHKSHSSKDCKHKSHKHDCDHKSHHSKDCKAKKSSKYDDDDCDHKSHNSKDCKHKDHKHHSTCDHKSHSEKDCKNKSSDKKANSSGSWSWWSWWNNDDDDDHDDDDDDDSPKVYLCHVPPGNPNNPQTLKISVNAVEAHLRNHSGDKLGSCDQQGCTETILTTTNPTSNTTTITAEESTASVVQKIVPPVSESDLTVKVMGNPSRSFFTIKMESKYELPVQVRIFDINGRPLESKANQLPNSTIQVGHNLGSGTYYAEFLQGTRKKVVQLIKVR